MAKKSVKSKSEKTKTKSTRLKVVNPKEISFEYIKSNQFRVVHADGIHGGLGPRGNNIQMGIFSERTAIPQKETYQVKDNRLGELRGKEGKETIIREVEVEVLMSLETAMAVNEWLKKKIVLLRKIQEELNRNG